MSLSWLPPFYQRLNVGAMNSVRPVARYPYPSS